MPEHISDSDARYALDLVRRICTEVGPGVPGSPQEGQRAAILARELESHLGAANVTIEEFTVAPGAFLSPYPGAFLMFAATALNLVVGRLAGIPPWLTVVLAALALVCAVLAPLLFICQFVFGLEWADPLFPKVRSMNVIGTLRGPGTADVKRLLIVSGHHDSAPESTWLRLTGYGFYFLSITYLAGSALMLVLSIIQLAGVIAGNAAVVRTGTLGWVLLAFPILPSILFALFINRDRKNGGTVPGAMDNLSASSLAVAMARFLVQNPSYIPPDTEIRFISFGSEEAGCRGSRRYVERHQDELRRLDARLLNAEMVAYPEIGILTSETNGTVKNSPEMVRSVVAAAERAGVPYVVKPASFGASSDAGPFSRAGLKATTLLPFKWPQQQVAFYHQVWDTPDVLNVEPLLNVLKLTFEWVRVGGEESDRPQ